MVIQEKNEVQNVQPSVKPVAGYVSNDNAFVSPKKKSVAIGLCLLLGVVGIHRFYVGKTKSGGLMILLSFVSGGLIGTIWALADLFTLVFTNNFTDADELPLVGNGVKVIFLYALLVAAGIICKIVK